MKPRYYIYVFGPVLVNGQWMFKIGWTSDKKAREATLRSNRGNPFRVRLDGGRLIDITPNLLRGYLAATTDHYGGVVALTPVPSRAYFRTKAGVRDAEKALIAKYRARGKLLEDVASLMPSSATTFPSGIFVGAFMEPVALFPDGVSAPTGEWFLSPRPGYLPSLAGRAAQMVGHRCAPIPITGPQMDLF